MPGTGNGTVTQGLTATQMKPTARGDGSFAFGAPKVTADAGLTDLAKDAPGCVLVARSSVDEAGGAEAAHWAAYESVVLRGRSSPTEVAVLAG